MQKRQKSKKRRFRRRCFLLAAVLIVSALAADAQLRPAVTAAARSQADLYATQAIQEAVYRQVEQLELDYGDLVRLTYSDQGTVTSLQTDMLAMSKLQSAVTSSVIESILEFSSQRVVLPAGSFCAGWAVLWLCKAVSPWLALLAEIFLCSQCLAAQDLRKESMVVYRKLVKEDLPAARRAVGRIVGRDTDALTAEGVTKAAVETIAENASDGETAPLFWMAIGGAPLALAYKAVNTMDSMVGYKNNRYLHFGRAAAKLDDAVNFLPARLAALLLVLSAGLTGMSLPGAWQIWRRDRRNHASPNSAQTESVCAGLLGLRLAGDAWYHGVLHEKPTIGDPDQDIRPGDIPRACRLMAVTAVLALAVCALARWLAVGLWG